MTTTKTTTWADDTDSDGEDLVRTVQVHVPPVQQQEETARAPAQDRSRERSDAPRKPQNAINPRGPYIVSHYIIDITILIATCLCFNSFLWAICPSK